MSEREREGEGCRKRAKEINCWYIYIYNPTNTTLWII